MLLNSGKTFKENSHIVLKGYWHGLPWFRPRKKPADVRESGTNTGFTGNDRSANTPGARLRAPEQTFCWHLTPRESTRSQNLPQRHTEHRQGEKHLPQRHSAALGEHTFYTLTLPARKKNK